MFAQRQNIGLTRCNCSKADLHVQGTEQGGVHVDLGGVISRGPEGGDDEGPVRAPGLLQGRFQQEHAVLVCVPLGQGRS